MALRIESAPHTLISLPPKELCMSTLLFLFGLVLSLSNNPLFSVLS